VDGSPTIGAIVFDTSNAASYNIGSGNVLGLSAGGSISVTSTVGAPQQIGANLILGTASGADSFTFTNNSVVADAILFFSGTISSGANSGTKTVTVTGAGSTEVYGSIDDGAGMVVLNKTDSGTLSLNGVNTFTGSTTVSGGALALTSAQSLRSTSKVQLNSSGKLELLGNRNFDRIADTARLALAGGELYARSANETMQGIDLSADSAIHLAIDGFQGVLNFSGMTRTGGILTIYDWIGSASGSGLDDRVFISGALAPDILANMHFEGYAPGATQLGTGEIVPGVVPEPGSIGLLLVGALGVLNRRRRAGC
jgi:autotransporter-associated beta strand protein